MISRESFDTIKSKFGDVSSWAVWADEGVKPKSNMADISVLDPDVNLNLLELLKPNIIMVGLNFSRPLFTDFAFKNFHDSNPYANDFKLRYAFRGTEFWGAYMTDIIKNFEMTDSKDVVTHLKQNPKFLAENIESFRNELQVIGATSQLIIAFGTDTFEILRNSFVSDGKANVVRATHYSHQISKEDYRREVLSQLAGVRTSRRSSLDDIEHLCSDLEKSISVYLASDEDVDGTISDFDREEIGHLRKVVLELHRELRKRLIG